jgi:hypothetical protein
MPIPGFRWAPRSLLGSNVWGFAKGLQADEEAHVTEKGLLGAYHGIKLDPMEFYNRQRIHVMKRRRSYCHCIIELEDSSFPAWETDVHYAVIMFRSISKESPGTDAVVGVVKTPKVFDSYKLKSHRVRGKVELEFKCRAWLKWADREDAAGKFVVQGDIIASEHKWYIG